VDLRDQRSGELGLELRDHLLEEKGVHRPIIGPPRTGTFLELPRNRDRDEIRSVPLFLGVPGTSRFSLPAILPESHVVRRNFPPCLHLNRKPDSEILHGRVKKP
jgi:hypothetical protein